MSKSMCRPLVLMFLLVLAVPDDLSAQTKETADVHGVVLDASGRPAMGYPMRIQTPQSGEVIIKPTERDGSFGVDGLPPGNYELRVFEPGGKTDNPIAAKPVTLAAGQAEKIEIRVGSDHPGAAAGSKSAAGRQLTGTTLGAIGANWTAVGIFALVLAVGLVAFLVLRVREKARS